MQVELDYGRNGIVVSVPDHSQVIRSHYMPGVPDEPAEITTSIRNPISSPPLCQVVKPGDQVCVVHTDITRATPNNRLIPVIVRELQDAGVDSQDILLLNGLGTHRPQTKAELELMLGKELVGGYRCLQHNAHDDENLKSIGVTSWGNPVRINKQYLSADIRILTGFIEPHFFAGFSGGPKAVLPALAGFESVGSNHSVKNIALPSSTWGKTQGNPIWEEMLEVALMTKPSFIINVALNADKKITAVFAGDMIDAHAEGCKYVKKNSMVPVDTPADIVITTNSGYPLDQNLYQSVKGMSAASRVVKRGGSIISVVACEEGLPDHGGYFRLLRRGGSVDGLLKMVNEPGFQEPDQWQVQIQAIIQKHADVYVFSDGLTNEQIQSALFLPCDDITHTLEKLMAKYGKGASIIVLPEGPQTVPYLNSQL